MEKGSHVAIFRVLAPTGSALEQPIGVACAESEGRTVAGSMTVWPSGLRRWLQAPVRKGVGSNPTAVTGRRCDAGEEKSSFASARFGLRSVRVGGRLTDSAAGSRNPKVASSILTRQKARRG